MPPWNRFQFHIAIRSASSPLRLFFSIHPNITNAFFFFWFWGLWFILLQFNNPILKGLAWHQYWARLNSFARPRSVHQQKKTNSPRHVNVMPVLPELLHALFCSSSSIQSQLSHFYGFLHSLTQTAKFFALQITSNPINKIL